MSEQPTTIVWFRQDLRLADHAALTEAARLGRVVPLYVWSPGEEAPWTPGGASRVWLHDSLASLQEDLAGCGAPLVIRGGPVAQALTGLATETGAARIFWSRRYEPHAASFDERLARELLSAGLEARAFSGALLVEPDEVRNQSGLPFQVYTPFAKACFARPEPREPLPAPPRLQPAAQDLAGLRLDELRLEPRLDWPASIRQAWTPGSRGAGKLLERFVHDAVAEYGVQRNQPAVDGTSRLSPHLHFGEISPRQVWHAIEDLRGTNRVRRGQWDSPSGPEVYQRELLWREFAHHLLVHFPHTDRQPLRADFERFPWCDDPARLRAWQRGLTGYPLVDAGMRQLWRTGWMHNRVRMVVASFLVKDLLIPWQRGAEWFWDTLVDADLANNTLGWQWTAGCGADAAPFFRIFNPTSQGEKFDPQGDYIRQWIPELARLPARWIHRPHEAPPEVLRDAEVRLGKNYPRPLVDHGESRSKALQAFAALQGSRKTAGRVPTAER